MKEFRMPSLGADMEGGTLVEWLKAPGEHISRGDIIAVVETVKGAIEIECFDDGVLERTLVEPGSAVAVGEVLARITGDGEVGPAVSEPVAAQAVPPRPIPPPAAAPDSSRPRISPAARRRASELGINLAAVATGPDGVVGIAEVNAAARADGMPEAPRKGLKAGLDRDVMRRAIGAAMARSKREIPHYYVSSTVDMTSFLDWLGDLNAGRNVTERILYAAPLLKAVALALRRAPRLNGTFVEGTFKAGSAIHVGVATALRGGGLIAPAIHDADELTIDSAMTKLRDVVERVRSGRMRGSEMTDPTVTLSILGEDMADRVFPVIYPPQVAIIGCGAIRERPWIVKGAVVARRVMEVAVAADHRVSDGRTAARFLKRLEAILNKPELL
jgi:pyruvate dehydrogenase E2 component (dihydrolipoamide acetyltransferase)